MKYRDDCVPDARVACTATQSSLVKRVCYDRAKRYMVIKLQQTDYHYCGIDEGTVAELLAADSKGRFYNARIKGLFDCRITPPPRY